jgi:two-component system LytT family response regulator
MVVRTGTALLRLNAAEIILIEADEPYSRVWIAEETAHLVPQPMKAWTEILPPEPFCRLDRSYIVNIDKVSGLHAVSRSENQVSFVGLQRVLTVGRAGATRLKQLLRSRDEALKT